MSKGDWKFKPTDMKRALRAAADAGLIVQRVEFGKDRWSIVTSTAAAATSVDDLDSELAEFEVRHGKG